MRMCRALDRTLTFRYQRAWSELPVLGVCKTIMIHIELIFILKILMAYSYILTIRIRNYYIAYSIFIFILSIIFNIHIDNFLF